MRCCLPIRSIHHLFFFPFNNAFTQTFPFITLYSFSLIHLLLYLIVFVFISALCLFVVLSIQICFRFLCFVFPLSFPFSFLSFSPSTTRTLLEPFPCSRVLVVKYTHFPFSHFANSRSRSFAPREYAPTLLQWFRISNSVLQSPCSHPSVPIMHPSSSSSPPIPSSSPSQATSNQPPSAPAIDPNEIIHFRQQIAHLTAFAAQTQQMQQ